MTLTQALLCPYDVIRCIYDVHIEQSLGGRKMEAEAFTKYLMEELNRRLVFGMMLQNVETEVVLLEPGGTKVKFSVYFEPLFGTAIPVINHTLYQPAWLPED